MHTYIPNDRIRFHHNGSFDGEIIICDVEKGIEIRIDGEDLLDFIADRYVRSRLEDITDSGETKDLLCLLPLLRKLDKAK